MVSMDYVEAGRFGPHHGPVSDPVPVFITYITVAPVKFLLRRRVGLRNCARWAWGWGEGALSLFPDGLQEPGVGGTRTVTSESKTTLEKQKI